MTLKCKAIDSYSTEHICLTEGKMDLCYNGFPKSKYSTSLKQKNKKIKK